MSSVRVLLVDDFEPWRQFCSSRLQEQPELLIICEAVDGLDAVQKAKELQPDLILLDIGLPGLDGIAAARRIRWLAPHSKILFVSQESSPEVVQEAFNLGARGFVVKSSAENDLMAAVNHIIMGKRFASGGLVIDNLTIPILMLSGDEPS
jgi:DNA-binding NarL/FixJ family response regulator